jgi:hypothetical protein
MEERCDSNPQDPQLTAGNTQRKLSGRELEITGLGVIASLIIAFWSLVGDGTLLLSQYLVFVSLLLVSAAGMVWRALEARSGRGAATRALEIRQSLPGDLRCAERALVSVG